MFERYTQPARIAIYCARHSALHAKSDEIDTGHVLLGLLRDPRVNTLFRLRELLPAEVAALNEEGLEVVKKDIPLSHDAKRVLAYTAIEADLLNDVWIDAEHLLLGMLREKQCIGAKNLMQMGINLFDARKIVNEQKSTRPDYGQPPVLIQDRGHREFKQLLIWVFALITVILTLVLLQRR
jgi:ATP-dependent Clp protease ATP-binding subunit ClpC